jgi:hypothetical protein
MALVLESLCLLETKARARRRRVVWAFEFRAAPSFSSPMAVVVRPWQPRENLTRPAAAAATRRCA